MADALDYGDPDDSQRLREVQERPPPTLRYDDDEGMGVTGMDEDLDMQEESARNQRKVQRNNDVKVYQYPDQLAVEAGARRGPSPLEEEKVEALAPQEPEIPPEVPSPIGGGQDIRLHVLHIAGTPITKLSTSRLFAYTTHFGAQPLGLEWINDSSVNVVFPDAAGARLALEYLCPLPSTSTTTNDSSTLALPTSEQLEVAVASQKEFKEDPSGNFPPWPDHLLESLLLPRKTHRFPSKLYNGIERDAARKAADLVAKTSAPAEYADDIPAIYREMEEEARAEQWNTSELKDLAKLQSALWARFAIESADIKKKAAARESKWYQQHGMEAGKEVVSKLLEVGDLAERPELLSKRSSGRGTGGKGRMAVDDLDQELDAMRKAREEAALDTYIDEEGKERRAHPRDVRSLSPSRRAGDRYGYGDDDNGRSGRNSRNRRGGQDGGRDRYGSSRFDDLDAEMEAYNEGRSGAGAANDLFSRPRGNGSSKSGVKVKGRGRVKAPGSSSMAGWGDDDGNNFASVQGQAQDEFGRSTSLRAETLAQRLGSAPGELTLDERLGAVRGQRSLFDRLG